MQIYVDTTSSFIIGEKSNSLSDSSHCCRVNKKFPKLNAHIQEKLLKMIVDGDEFYLLHMHASQRTVIMDFKSA